MTSALEAIASAGSRAYSTAPADSLSTAGPNRLATTDGGGLLRETFVHIAGIGRPTERRLWGSGIRSWAALRVSRVALRRGVVEALERSEEALEARSLEYFFGALPATERWRTFTDFGDEFIAVDIETTGLSTYDEITAIGIESGGCYRAFIRGTNLQEAEEVLGEAGGIITFNGSSFDLPFIKRTFPRLRIPEAHVDLRFLSRRVGLEGSLKRVEIAAELSRAASLADISGYEATVLWNRYQFDGDDSALAELVTYNAADTCVLRPLAVFVVNRLQEALAEQPRPSDTEQLLFDPDTLVEPLAYRAIAPPPISPPRVEANDGQLSIGSESLSLPADRQPAPIVDLELVGARMRDPDNRIVGIDLTGSDGRPSGWALLQGEMVVTGTLGSTREIIDRTLACKPRLVSIDSPLSLPVGRHCTDDLCDCRRIGGITRHCERTLKRRGINVYPCLIQSMQALTARGMHIAAALRAEGIEVIESYPGGAQDVMRIPRKQASLEQLRNGLERFGVRGIRSIDAVTHDELDAVTSAVVGAFFLADLYEPLGNEKEGYLILPRPPTESSFGITEPSGHVARADEPVCLLVGSGAASVALDLELDDSCSSKGSSSVPSIVISVDAEKYWSALARHGPRMRSVCVESGDVRLPRRPRFVDLHVHQDDADTHTRVREWLATWLNEGEETT